MSSLWPDSFDADGNKTDWRYSADLEEYYSPSTGDFMYTVQNDPPVEDRMAWIEAHKDAILMTPCSPRGVEMHCWLAGGLR